MISKSKCHGTINVFQDCAHLTTSSTTELPLLCCALLSFILSIRTSWTFPTELGKITRMYLHGQTIRTTYVNHRHKLLCVLCLFEINPRLFQSQITMPCNFIEKYTCTIIPPPHCSKCLLPVTQSFRALGNLRPIHKSKVTGICRGLPNAYRALSERPEKLNVIYVLNCFLLIKTLFHFCYVFCN